MKRGGYLNRRTPLAISGHSETSEVKKEIQAVAREIVIIRDGGCILRNIHYRDFPECGGYRNDGELILQADHLVTRANNATFADTRLIVCVCKAHHAWKSLGSNARKKEYDELVRTLLPSDRVALWDACERDSWKPNRGAAFNWTVTLAALKQELREIQRDSSHAA